MADSLQSLSDAVDQFLATGEHDKQFRAWSGNAAQRKATGEAKLSRILGRIVAWRARGAPIRQGPVPPDLKGQVRSRVAPMVRGLLPRSAEAVLAELPQRVEVVTVQRFNQQVKGLPLGVQWSLANLVLDDLGAPPLTDDVPQIDGLCAEGRAWVLPGAFGAVQPFGDVVVHEVAHLLHSISPAALGVGSGKRPLMRVTRAHRETFAYTCEAWSCVLRDHGDGRSLAESLQGFREGALPPDSRVDRGRLVAVLEAAVEAGVDEGWRCIRRDVRVG